MPDDPNAPGTPDQPVDQGTPDQAEANSSVSTPNTQPPADAPAPDQADDLGDFAEDVADVQGMTPDQLAERARGMQRKLTQRTMELAEERKQTEALNTLMREKLAEAQSQPEEAEPAQQSTKPKSRYAQYREKLNDAEGDILDALLEEAETRAQGKLIDVQRVAQNMRLDAERNQMRAQHPDFDKICTVAACQRLERDHGVRTFRAAYDILKAEALRAENATLRKQLVARQNAAQARSATERPGGPSAHMIGDDEFEAMPAEKRRELSFEQIAVLAEKKLSRRT
jgi:hypothetical protein